MTGRPEVLGHVACGSTLIPVTGRQAKLHGGVYTWACEELALGGLLQPRSSSSSSSNSSDTGWNVVPGGAGAVNANVAAAAGGQGKAVAGVLAATNASASSGAPAVGQRGVSGGSSSSAGGVRAGQSCLGGSYALVFTAYGLQPGYVMVALPEVVAAPGAKSTGLSAAGGKVGATGIAATTARLNK